MHHFMTAEELERVDIPGKATELIRGQLVVREPPSAYHGRIATNRFGNKFGAGPMRFRLYTSGAVQGLLLDEIAPDWKRKIFAPGVYLTALLDTALHLSADRRTQLIAQAKNEYGYDTVLVNRQALETEGRRLVQQKVDAILNTQRTLVTIDYAGAGDINAMSYTPFGITAVDEHTAIYDLVPIAIQFRNRVVLRMKVVTPLLIDRQAKTVTFAVSSAPSLFEGKAASALDLSDLSLTASPNTTISVSGNKVRIQLR